MMYTREVVCVKPHCGKPATHKIASPWSYGKLVELKTYGLACDEHQAEVLGDARRRCKLHPPSPDEIVGEIGVYRYEKGKHGKDLERLPK